MPLNPGARAPFIHTFPHPRTEYEKINEAYERMQKNDVRYRFVIDIASLK
jgi:D-arabinose 1-dehydrogenase-like Zn-dependent alcohol dehydrogenase